MKSVLISIQPKWCELIASGKKTVEVRKTRPKIDTPFKVYIYQTKKPVSVSFSGTGKHISEYDKTCFYNERSGKVIGEFVCDCITNYEAELWDDETFERIQEFYEPEDFNEYGEYAYQTLADNSDDFWKEQHLCKVSCVSIEELRKYLGLGINKFYGWHISDLVIYDKPKELSEFYSYNCGVKFEDGYPMPTHEIKRPPQSWCYVEKGGVE